MGQWTRVVFLLALLHVSLSQSIDSFLPTRAPQSQGTLINIVGVGMAQSADDLLSVTIAGIDCFSFEFIEPTLITCVTGASPTATSGPVTVTNSNGTLTSTEQFTYDKSPTITLVEPAAGPNSGNTTIVISVAMPASDSVVSILIGSVPCGNIKEFLAMGRVSCLTGATSSEGSMPIELTAQLGGVSNTNVTYRYVAQPKISSFSPLSGPMAGNTMLKIYGSSFGGSRDDIKSVSAAGVPCSAFTYQNNTHVTCITGKASTNARGVVVLETYYGGNGTSTGQYTYNPLPYVESVSPTNGPMTGNTTLSILGNALGSSLVDVESITVAGVSCLSITYKSNSELSCVTQPTDTPRTAPVVVTTISGGTSDSTTSYTYNPLPIVKTVTPDHGPPSGGTLIYIHGEALGTSADDLSTIVVAGHSCTSSANWYNSSFITCITAPRGEGGASGPVVVTTLSGGDGSTSMNAFFHYDDPPVVSSVTPQSGSATSYTVVEIRGGMLGESLADVLDVVVGGQSCRYSLTYISSSHLSCITPPSASSVTGPVMVTTLSGGESSYDTTVEFTYTPSCYVYSAQEACEVNKCVWCSASSTCLSDEASCPVNCYVGAISCASFVVIMLTVVLMVVVAVGVRIIVHYVNRDDALKRSLKRFQRKFVREEEDTDTINQ